MFECVNGTWRTTSDHFYVDTTSDTIHMDVYVDDFGTVSRNQKSFTSWFLAYAELIEDLAPQIAVDINRSYQDFLNGTTPYESMMQVLYGA